MTEHDDSGLDAQGWRASNLDAIRLVRPLVRDAREYVTLRESDTGIREDLDSLTPQLLVVTEDVTLNDIPPGQWAKMAEVLRAAGLISLQHETMSPENVTRAVATASRDGIAGLTPVQLLIVVLVWLLAFGLPVADQTLPPEAQAVISGDVGTAALAIAITTLIIQQRER